MLFPKSGRNFSQCYGLWNGIKKKNPLPMLWSFKQSNPEKGQEDISFLCCSSQMPERSCLMFLSSCLFMLFISWNKKIKQDLLKFPTFPWVGNLSLHENQESLFIHVVPIWLCKWQFECHRRWVGKLATLFAVIGPLWKSEYLISQNFFLESWDSGRDGFWE